MWVLGECAYKTGFANAGGRADVDGRGHGEIFENIPKIRVGFTGVPGHRVSRCDA